MKPRNDYQKNIISLSEKLSPVTDNQIQWAWDNCLSNYYTHSRNTNYCLECGHKWNEENHIVFPRIAKYECPECGKELEYIEYSNCNNSTYFGIFTTMGNMQIFRILWVEKMHKKGEPAYHISHEVMQHWIDINGKVTSLSKNVNGYSQCYDRWIFRSELEVRPKSFEASPRYNIQPYKIYPGRCILPILKRNGFTGHLYGLNPQKLFSKLLSDKKAEILLKGKQIQLLQSYFDKYNKVEKYWQSVKICIRNKYTIKDAITWIDYIELLEYFNKDLRNSHYVCPNNLKKEHDRLVKKKREIQKREKLEKIRERVEASQLEYQEQKQMYFGLTFSDNEITVKVLEHVNEFMEEGDELGHCVFTNEYYEKDNSLIMSARIEDKPVETIEISLSDLTIKQARGKRNKSTKYHNRIINLVNNNMHAIGSIKRQTV